LAIETLQYVYQLSDFDTSGGNITPPNEAGARAQGNPPFNIQLNAGGSPLQVVVNDTDNDGLDEINSTGQTLDQAVTIDGVTYAVGDRVLVNYTLVTADGFRVHSITIGSGNTGNNTTTALISEQPLVPGQQYVFTQELNVGSGELSYDALACFGAGTLIRTPTGDWLVEDLTAGDLIETLDRGALPLQAVYTTTVPAMLDDAPIVFADGALNNTGNLTLSPNHRVLVAGADVELALGLDQALVAAKHLVNDTTIRRQTGGMVTYYHLLFEDHEIIFSNGIATESYYPDANDADPQSTEFNRLFPHAPAGDIPFARPVIRRYEATTLQRMQSISADPQR